MSWHAWVSFFSWIDTAAPIVWIIVTLGYLYAIYILREGVKLNIFLIVGLLVAIYAYPVYTDNLTDNRKGLVGNFCILGALLLVSWKIRSSSDGNNEKLAARIVLYPAVPWAVVASAYIVLQLLAENEASPDSDVRRKIG
eukprot:CAMPEP_0171099644 /NCGR_PEP_ID=MMETSP0766_2-20121228/52156_1 /TAXON_ID=439317 /ORGANISM="Gambierdiscus australes, Strain CAWD 149" /LENGTH=139 /DNA_ID=CAMNT_0011559311 /DNA_START=28 /DNA_END=447 /DNA_ORIENTATION=-